MSERERRGLSPISAPAAGPFPPQISPEGIPRVPPTQLGPAPAAELPRGGLKKKYSPDKKPGARGGNKSRGSGERNTFARNNKSSRAALRAVRRITQCPLATGFPRSFVPKG